MTAPTPEWSAAAVERAVKIRGCGCWLDLDDLCPIHVAIRTLAERAFAAGREEGYEAGYRDGTESCEQWSPP
jgi:hypothetical protein